MEDPQSTKNKTCSCQQKSDCPLNEHCLSECLVHNAAVNTSTMNNYYRTFEKIKDFNRETIVSAKELILL